MRLLRVNMTNLKATFEDLPEEWKLVGGRGLTGKILGKEVSPKVDPLGPEAKLIVAKLILCGKLVLFCLGTEPPKSC